MAETMTMALEALLCALSTEEWESAATNVPRPTAAVARAAKETLLVMTFVMRHARVMAKAPTLAFETRLLTCTDNPSSERRISTADVARSTTSTAGFTEKTFFARTLVVWHRRVMTEASAFALEARLLTRSPDHRRYAPYSATTEHASDTRLVAVHTMLVAVHTWLVAVHAWLLAVHAWLLAVHAWLLAIHASSHTRLLTIVPARLLTKRPS